MLSLGLYIMAGHDTTLPYAEIWKPGQNIVDHDHAGGRADLGYDKYILLLRDYHTLWSTLIPDGTHPTHQGSYGLGSTLYCHLLQKILKIDETKRKIVYFEDLLTDNEVYHDVATFVGIEYDKEKIDFNSLRTETKRLYIEAGHTPSPKQPISPAVEEDLHSAIISVIGTETFDKYLKRYDRRKEA